MRKKQFSDFSFQFFFAFWAKLFSDFWRKIFKKLSKLPSVSPEEQFVAWNFFLKFWIVLNFLQKPSACFSKFYQRVQSKNCGRNSSLIFLFWIFSDFERKNFQTFGEKSSKCCQNYLLRVQRNNLWLEIFFKSFGALWIFCRNLWHGSQVSIYVSRVKFAEEIVFFILPFWIFSGFWAKSFSDFWPKNVKNLSKLPSTWPEEQVLAWIFFKFWIVSGFLQKPLAWFSKFYLRVQIENCGKKTVFFVFFSEFFRFLSEKFSDFWPNLQKVVKTTFCVSRGTTCGFKIFWKVLNRFGFSTETFGMVLKFLSTCPE